MNGQPQPQDPDLADAVSGGDNGTDEGLSEQGETSAGAGVDGTQRQSQQHGSSKANNKKRRVSASYGSRTTIVETGQKRRSCICSNNKACNEIMTKWAKVSPSNYHYVQLPKLAGAGAYGGNDGEHAVVNAAGRNISDTELYKNGFRLSTLRYLDAKNPLPKDERVALCHYHPEVRPYLFWPKNTPAHCKYAIPRDLAASLTNGMMDIDVDRCTGLNTDGWCYVVPCYDFETAKNDILAVEKEFYEKVKEIKNQPTKFTREYQAMKEKIEALEKENKELKQERDEQQVAVAAAAAVALAAPVQGQLQPQRWTTYPQPPPPQQQQQQPQQSTHQQQQATYNPHATFGAPAATFGEAPEDQGQGQMMHHQQPAPQPHQQVLQHHNPTNVIIDQQHHQQQQRYTGTTTQHTRVKQEENDTARPRKWPKKIYI